MITADDFSRLMGVLNEVFRDFYAPPPRRNAVWRHAQRCTLAEFERVVDQVIDTYRAPPTPNLFKDLVQQQIRLRPKSLDEIIEVIPIYCEWCQDTGVCQVRHDVSQILAYCYCDCPVRVKFGRGGAWALPVFGGPGTEGWGRELEDLSWMKPVGGFSLSGPEEQEWTEFESKTGLILSAYLGKIRDSELIWGNLAKEMAGKGV